MRIQVAVDTWGLIGGSERYAGEVVRALVDRGHAVRVLAGRLAEDSADHSGRLPAHPTPVDSAPAYAEARPTADALDQLEACVRRCDPDVLLVLSGRSRPAARRLDALRPRVPCVRFVQDHTLFCPGLNKLHASGQPCVTSVGATCLEHYFLRDGCTGFRPAQHVRPWLDGVSGVAKTLDDLTRVGRSQRVLVASHYMRCELLDAGLDPLRVEVLPYFTRSNTADVPSAPPPGATRDFLAASEAPLVFTPARLTLPDKGLDRLLEALAQIARPWRAVLAGAGPAEQELRQRARAAGLEQRVHFTGWLSSGAIEYLYERAAIVAFPSVWDEPFGLVGLEAMAHGRPVVAFDVGGVGEWLQPDATGLLVPRADVEGLARALTLLLDDPERARRLGAAGRARVDEHFGREQHLARLEQVLARAVSDA